MSPPALAPAVDDPPKPAEETNTGAARVAREIVLPEPEFAETSLTADGSEINLITGAPVGTSPDSPVAPSARLDEGGDSALSPLSIAIAIGLLVFILAFVAIGKKGKSRPRTTTKFPETPEIGGDFRP